VRGHDEVIALRRRGLRPPTVWIADGRYMPDKFWCYLRDCGELGDQVELDATDQPGRADLRWAIGLTVNLCGSDELRIGRFARAFADAGAARVIASWGTVRMRADGEYICDTHRMTFSNEELAQWPQ
jgi:hypothetical protein